MTSQFMAEQITMELREAETTFLDAHKRAEEATLTGADKEVVRRANGERDRAEETMKNRREELRSYTAAMRLEAVRLEIGPIPEVLNYDIDGTPLPF